MDDSVKTISRQVSTLEMVISKTGGVMSVVFILTLVIVQRLQRTIYFTSLVSSIYQYQFSADSFNPSSVKKVVSINDGDKSRRNS